LIKKTHLGAHVTKGSYSMLTRKHVVEILEISTMCIARYEFLNSQLSLFWPCEKSGSYTSQAHICMKKCPKWWYFFGFILQIKLPTCLKNFRSFEIVQHIGKK